MRYIIVFCAFFLAFFLGENLENSRPIGDSAVSPNSECVADAAFSKDNEYPLDDSWETAAGDYYRVMFEMKSDVDTNFLLKAISKFGKTLEVEKWDAKASKDYLFYETIFRSDGNYKKLVFENEENLAKTHIRNVRISRLAIHNDEEMKKIKPTLFGSTSTGKFFQSQTEQKDANFSDLKNNKAVIGQIFKATEQHFSSVMFDVEEFGNGGAGNYRLEIRSAKLENGAYSVDKQILAYLEFSSLDLQKYQQQDSENEVFPISVLLKKNQYYFIGVTNENVKTNYLNHLELKGSKDSNLYENGDAVAVDMDGSTKKIGDLFFAAFGVEFSRAGEAILPSGAVIEDLGGKGSYLYETKNSSADFLDLYSFSQGKDQLPLIKFNEYEKIISGSPEKNAYYTYKFNTVYPFSALRVQARQMYAGWYDVKIFYSFDNRSWEEVKSVKDKKAVQQFDQIIEGDGLKKEVYFKVTYDPQDNKEIKLFGLRNFKLEGELN